MKKRTAKRILIICLAIAAAAALTAGIVLDSMRVDVCLDPGHGGDDSGAQYEGRLEKDDNLELALAVEKELKARGVKVCMTRDDDTFISRRAVQKGEYPSGEALCCASPQRRGERARR